MKTFKIGGIHPEENKLTKECAITTFPLPKQATIFFTQHLGAPSTPIIQKGDKVKVGQLIAKADAFICANLHSPVSGVVQKIEPIADLSGYKKMAAIIDVDGDEWEENIDISPDLIREISLTKDEIIERLKSCGIVGLGGACFPTHVKYMIPPDKKVDYLIINAAECEPYITADHRIMLEKTEQCLVGIQALLRASEAPVALIGIEANKSDVYEHLKRYASQYPNIQVIKLKTKYPQGAEKQLIHALTGRRVPNGKLPIEVGCIVNNITTAHAVYEAVQKNKPLVETFMTVSGKNLPSRYNFKVRLGTPVQDIITYVSIPMNTGKIVSGGPMMGKAMANISSFVVKGMSSLLFLDENETKRGKIFECLHCGKCLYACPMHLEPFLLHSLVLNGRFEEGEKNGLMNCIECGSCQYVCPSNRPILDMIRTGKIKINALKRTPKK